MSGIAGIYNLENKDVDLRLIDKMVEELSHRGPDDKGSVLLSTDAAAVSFKEGSAEKRFFQPILTTIQ